MHTEGRRTLNSLHSFITTNTLDVTSYRDRGFEKKRGLHFYCSGEQKSHHEKLNALMSVPVCITAASLFHLHEHNRKFFTFKK